MNRALWLLIGLQLRGWARYLGRSLRTVKGGLLAVVGGGVFVVTVSPVLFFPAGKPVPHEDVRLYGPAALLAYCLMNVLLSSDERAVYFSPAEVNFLFPGPFHRRGLLVFKITSTLLIGLPTALLMLIFLKSVFEPWLPAAVVGLLLMFVFLQLFGMVVNLLATSFGIRLYSRSRKVLAALVAGLILLALFQAGVLPPRLSAREMFAEIAGTTTWKSVSLPLRCFIDTFLASKLWPDLLASAGLALLVDLALLGVVLALDANYLEAAAASSARVYARIQRLRRAGLAGDSPRGGTWLRRSLPGLPYWGGIGPNLWRQMTAAARGLGRLGIVLGTILLLVVLPMLNAREKAPGEMATRLAGILAWLTVFLTTLIPFDFRGDVDRMALLKTLPMPAWRLTLGQLLTPVLFMTAVQWGVLAAALPFCAEGGEAWLLGLAAFAPPLNFLLFGLDNLLFLLFPTRLVATTPGDFQAIGRNVLYLLAKVLVLTVVGLAAAVVAAVTLLTTRSHALAWAAAWPVVVVCGAAMIPLVALAFRAFDVGRDTPA